MWTSNRQCPHKRWVKAGKGQDKCTKCGELRKRKCGWLRGHRWKYDRRSKSLKCKRCDQPKK